MTPNSNVEVPVSGKSNASYVSFAEFGEMAALSRFRTDAALARHQIWVEVSEFAFPLFLPLFHHRVAEIGQGILTNMFEHVAA